MPTYEYACRNCGQHLEVVQSFKDDPLTECALCGGQLRKVFSAVGIAFRGSGFYKTDSRTGAPKTAASTAKTSGDTSSDGSTSSDTKTSDTKTSDTKTSDTKTSDTKTSSGASTSSDSASSAAKTA